MAITTVDKIKINKYLKEHAIGDIYYLDMCDYLGKRGKISDVEFLEYFTNYVVSEFQKDEKISANHLSKVVSVVVAFLKWINESKSEINEETLDKIRSFKEFYDNYLNRTGFDMDLGLNDNYITDALKTIDELYPAETKSESSMKYINKITELEDYIRKLERQLDENTRLYDSLQTKYTKSVNKTDSLNEKNECLESEIGIKVEEIRKTNETIESLNAKISELSNFLSVLQEENQELSRYKEEVHTLTSEVSRLKNVVDENEKEKVKELNSKSRNAIIEELIYKKILLERLSIDEIVNYINSQGFNSNKDEISKLLGQIALKINIDNNTFSLQPTYKVDVPRILENGQFSICIPKGKNYYDIMLTSDFHIREFENKELSGFHLLNDYCVKKDINLVLNLGDFFHGTYFACNNAEKNYKLVEEAITSVPKVDGIYHAILGGNHDRNITKYGFDPLKLLSDNREDIINLGYTHSTVSLESDSDTIGKFDLHHPNSFDFPIDLDDDGIDIVTIDKYLKKIYASQGRSRNDSYIDLFGHTHKSQFNYMGSYCYIPSLIEGRGKRGACHLRIYFDEDTKIKYMVFMPLSVNGGLVKNNEIIYQKVLRK